MKPDDAISRSISTSIGRRANLVTLAIAWRRLRASVLLLFGSIGACLIADLYGYRELSFFAGGAAIIALIAVAAMQFRLARACGETLDEAICFLGLSILLPPSFLLWVLWSNYEGRWALRKAGVKCGWLGVPNEELQRLIVGMCSRCGYDMRSLGSAAVCPECGAARGSESHETRSPMCDDSRAT